MCRLRSFHLLGAIHKIIPILPALFLSAFTLIPSGRSHTVEVNWDGVDQIIDGFGGSDASYPTDYTKAQADLFFSTKKGIGLSFLRAAAYTEPGRRVRLCNTMREAVARGAKVWASDWSPPAAWKSNHSEDHGGYLLPQHFQDYANFQTQYVKDVKSHCGVTLYALSVQNEPNFNAPYASADWTAENFHDYILNNLGPTFAANDITTKIMIPEELSWAFGDASATIKDPNAAKYVSLMGVHDYGGTPTPYSPAQDQGKHLWETEVSDFNAPDRRMDSALHYARLIHQALVNANVNAWHYWWLIDSPNNRDNEDLTMPNGKPTKRLYMMGNFSRFIRPGYYRIAATAAPATGLLVSAYKNPTSGSFAIVAINSNRSKTSLHFSFRGFTASTVTPWVTDDSHNLAQRSVVSAGSGFTYSLPPASLTTFTGAKASLSAP